MVSRLLPRQKCTILLPVRNGDAYIHNSMQNLREIAGPFDEILVLNDGSTDSTSSILSEIQKIDSRIVIINLPPSGLVVTLNAGIELAKNDYIARADVDDLYSLERLNLQIEVLESNPRVAAVFSDYTFWSDSNLNLGYMATAVTASATRLSIADGFRTPHPSVMFSKSKAMSVGGYRSEEFPAEDLGLWIRLASNFELATVPMPLLDYRINPTGVTSSRKLEMISKRNALLATLDYRELISTNIDSYNEYKIMCAGKSHQYDRLALHNFDLFLCIFRGELHPIHRLLLVLRVGCRFANLKVLLAFAGLISDRRRRK